MAKKKILPLGTKGYAVHKHYADSESKEGGRIIPCKLMTYSNEDGEVCPQYTSTLRGIQAQFTNQNHHIYNTLEEAIEAIKTKPVKKKK